MKPENWKKRNTGDLSLALGKLPPQATDIEESVLGAIISEKNAILEVVDKLQPEHFYAEAHKLIFEAVLDLFSEANPIDMRTVVARLRKNGTLEAAGGALSVATLTSKVSTAANVEYHARILQEMAIKRFLIEIASNIHQDSFDETTDVFSVLERAGTSLQSVHDQLISSKNELSTKEYAYAVLKELQARMSGAPSGVRSGFESFDRHFNGLSKTDLIILAARPGMGKSAFAFQLALQVAQQKEPVGIFSLEMSGQQLIERLACVISEIDSDKVRKGKDFLSPYEFERYSDALGQIAGLPLHIDDSGFMTIVDLRARAIRMKKKYGIRLLVIDYLQLIKGTNERGMTRDQEVGIISRTLKGIAKELDITIVCLSQLSRAVEQRGGVKRPQLSDLRESGSIEQDADIVMFLYRPEYYGVKEDSDGMPTHGLCEVIIAKFRNGSTGTVNMKFIGKFTKFANWFGETPSHTERQLNGVSHYKDPTNELHKQKDDDLPF